jgi:putative holliday junction resolvase
MRILALDVGQRRVGFAISDPSGLLARPLMTIDLSGHDPVERVAAEIARLAAEDDGIAAVVVGLPRRLDGTASDQTGTVERERDWRKRKARLDAAAAAVILQDYLDRQAEGRAR